MSNKHILRNDIKNGNSFYISILNVYNNIDYKKKLRGEV